MSEQHETQEAEEQPNDPPEVEEPEGGEGEGKGTEVEPDDPPQEQESAARQRAREKGWVPKGEYRGDPSDWVDEHEFLKTQGQVRRERDDLSRKVQGLERNMEMLRKDTETIREKAEREGYERAYNEITARQRRAVEDGDTVEWERLEGEKRKLEPPAQKKDDGGQSDPVIQGWIQENPWFNSDPALNMEAQAIHVRLSNKHPHMPLEENLRRVTDEIQRRYPEEFGIDPEAVKPKPQYRRPQRVSGSEAKGGNSSGGGKKGWADLPAEIRQTAKSLIGEGNIYRTQDDYAKSYFRQYPEG